jgi:hypothetical protein
LGGDTHEQPLQETPPALSHVPEALRQHRYGAGTAEQNLRRAIDAGILIELEDGSLKLPPAEKRVSSWMEVPNGPPLDCHFLLNAAFDGLYGGAAVPHGCRDCYKVKARLGSLRQLMAAWKLGKSIPCLSKWGLDLGNPFSQDVYAGYLYATGLDAARVLHKVVRDAFDTDPALGPGVPLTIKRGCSKYEVALGPSDRYEFTPEMAELEALLRSRFVAPVTRGSSMRTIGRWIQAAYQMGDDTYLDLTGGKRLLPPSVTYAP